MPRTPSARQSASSKLQERLKDRNVAVDSGHKVLWQGPCAEGPNGGITFSMLTRFLTCRERFRVQYIDGIKPVERFNHRTDYGTMWHLCEEALASNNVWVAKLEDHCDLLIRRFPLDQENILHWYNVCRTQFPVYVEHWRQHDDVKKRVPLMQEQVFDVPYKLPSGRTVRLRGKFDSVDLIDGGVWLQENKTKGDVDVQQIQRQLTFDLQTMMYLIALTEASKDTAIRTPAWQIGESKTPIKGVRYNVVRRPLSGGKGTIVRHKPTKSNPQGESWEDYYKRVEQVIRENPDHFFSRWKTEVLPGDIQRFRRECLDPILENLCLWYEWVNDRLSPHDPAFAKGMYTTNFITWRHPFGAVNTIDEYGSSDVDEYINNRSMTGLRRVNTLFEELV